uniref:Efflux RND transporter periplasmic adaptor subunit n=1 Tax=Prevotella sp. GTC17260 TaxID=3236796 RepID=A0AB33JJD5_9BACT
MDIQIKHKKYIIPRKYWPWIGGATVVGAALLWLALGNYSHTLRVERRIISIADVKEAQFNDYVSVDGQVVPISIVQISPQEGGVVVEKVVEEGSHVHKGDVLLRLSNTHLDLEILNAESELAEKQNMLRNTQISLEQDALTNHNDKLQQDMDVERKRRDFQHKASLYQERLISREEYLQAQEDWKLAAKRHSLIDKRIQQDNRYRRAQIDQLNDNLDNMKQNVELVRQRKERLNVRSLIDGEVGTLDVELGQNIAPGQRIGQINDMSDFKVQAFVDEHYIDRVHAGLSASFQHNGQTYRLQMRKVYPEVANGRFKVDFVFDGRRPTNIRTGQTYYLDLQLGAAKKAVIIPKGTFYSTTGGTWIFVVDESGNKAYRRKIRIGRQNPQYYEVLEGLQPGEEVIVSGYEAYKDSEVLKF